MSYLLWLFVVALILVLVKQYFSTKIVHSAAANAVFAKYTMTQLTPDKQRLVLEKAAELSATDNLSEIERYGWCAIAMHTLGIPSAVPENPSWYHKVNPGKVYPNNILLNSVISFVDKQYSIKVKFGDEQPAQGGVQSEKNENKPRELES